MLFYTCHIGKKGYCILGEKLYDVSNFEAQFKRSTISLLVLQLLSEREMYAYEIILETAKRSDGKYKMPLLYNVLNKFKEQGYVVESRKEVSDSNRVRIYYAITSDGLIYLSKLKEEYTALTDAVQKIISHD